jgi:hypothetical protein
MLYNTRTLACFYTIPRCETTLIYFGRSHARPAQKSVKRGAPEKAVLAWWLRQRTTVPLR